MASSISSAVVPSSRTYPVGPIGFLLAGNILRMVGRLSMIDLHRSDGAMLFDGHRQLMKRTRMPVFRMGIGDVVEGVAAVGVPPVHIGLAYRDWTKPPRAQAA